MKSKKQTARAAEAKKMKAFLESEGWYYERSIFPDIGGLFWKDPGYRVSVSDIERAYAIAMKRKAARECRALKKAGFYFSGFSQKWFHVGLSFSNPIFVVGWPRSEALSKLATARRSRKDPFKDWPEWKQNVAKEIQEEYRKGKK